MWSLSLKCKLYNLLVYAATFLLNEKQAKFSSVVLRSLAKHSFLLVKYRLADTTTSPTYNVIIKVTENN